MRMRLVAAVAAALALCSCYGSETFEGDASLDTASEVPVDTVADTVADTAVDTDADTTSLDVPSEPDVVPDPPTDSPSDPPYDHMPDPTCIAQGCIQPGEGVDCCPGLDTSMDCDPTSDPACSGLQFCVDCGNGWCEAHENRDNCWEDCMAGCGETGGMGYSCGLESHSCECVPPECYPVCSMASGARGWYDLCTMTLIASDTDCMYQHAECREIGSWSEGWYESGTGELIEWAMCANEWRCEVTW